MPQTLILGQTLDFSGNPFTQPWQDTVQHRQHGAILVDGDRIVETGDTDTLCRAHPQTPVRD
ncbi:MAG: guanine deaminase, partial [Paracoccaceae bacterium]|nr:guanine deaminase [Paracoccaceae bacterium]